MTIQAAFVYPSHFRGYLNVAGNQVHDGMSNGWFCANIKSVLTRQSSERKCVYFYALLISPVYLVIFHHSITGVASPKRHLKLNQNEAAKSNLILTEATERVVRKQRNIDA